MFATLLLDVPVEGGYSGGSIQVRQHLETEVLDLSAESHRYLSFALMYADCRHQIEAITAGTRLMMRFDLIVQGSTRIPSFVQLAHFLTVAPESKGQRKRWTSAMELARNGAVRPPSCAVQRYTPLLLAIHDTHQLLEDWNPREDDARFMALPLVHNYTEKNLSFDRLKGVDRWIAHLFCCLPFLDCHLARLTTNVEYNERARVST